jgi:pimeloyl-ACP methyl ester carboxylesterase
MNHVPIWRAAALCLLSAALALSACGGSEDKNETLPVPIPVDRRSTLAFSPCAVPIADPSAICGILTVAEDSADSSSRLIGLQFAILLAKSEAKASDPIVIFTGGPGPSSLRFFENADADTLTQYPLRQQRDVIVMTQRGADLTTPLSLECRELALDFNGGERFADESAVVAAATCCRDRLTDAGLKLSAYTTQVIARDMEDLRVLLGVRRGFSQWNVVGSSYGSLLAQVYARDTPQGVRSVVYDGRLPLTDRSLYYAGQLDALTNVIGACNAQSDCAATYPNLRNRFASAIERLKVNPAMVRGVPVRGVEVLNAVRAPLAAPQAEYAKLPLFMDRVAAGDLVGADALAPFIFNVDLAASENGMYYTVTCTNEGGVGTPPSNSLPTGGAGWPDAVRRLSTSNGIGPAARLCPLWTQGQTLSTTVANPLRSNIPSLITVGQFDGSTPTTSADSLQVGLSRAYKIVFTGRGHGLLEGDVCMLQLTATFLDDLTRSSDTICIDQPSSLRFTPPAL